MRDPKSGGQKSVPPNDPGVPSSDKLRQPSPQDVDGSPFPAPADPEPLHPLIDAIPAGIVYVDKDIHVRTANRTARTILGKVVAGAAFSPGRDYSLHHPDGAPLTGEELPLNRAVKLGESTRDIEILVRRTDGSEIIVLAAGAPIRDQSGEIAGAVTVFQEITQRKRVEVILQRYRLLWQHARDIIIFVRIDGRIIEANDAALKAYGYSREELLSKNIYDLRAEETAPQVAAQMAAAETRGILFETVHRRKDGSTFPVEVSSLGSTIGDERVLLSVIRDITDRKRAETERERLLGELDATINSIADAVMIYGPTAEIVRMNRSAEALLGYTAEDRKRPLPERVALLRIQTEKGQPFPPEELPPRRALKGETVRGVLMIVHSRKGKALWISASAAPIRTTDGRLLGAVTTLTDVSELRELQEQREDLVRSVSHDLRNPLTAVLGQAELLQRMLDRSGEKGRLKQAAAAIEASARRMNSMIQDLVDSARLESGHLRLEKRALGLREFVTEVINRLRAVLDVDRVRVEIPAGLPMVEADPTRMERVFANLIGNALKYSPPNTDVTIRAATVGNEVEVSVSDQGVGIAPDDIPHIFERFYRAKGARKAEGLGLGLYITQQLLEAQGGGIWVESSLGRGSTFRFTLPIRRNG